MPRLADLQALEILLRLPDDAALTTDEAAIVLRTSPRTLERMRAPDSTTKGPEYIQGGDRGARGANQRVTYTKRALQDWQRSHTVSNNLEAAVRRGQLFSTVGSLAEPTPFWTDASGRFVGPAEEDDIETFLDRLGWLEVEWATPLEAATREWEDGAAFVSCAKRIAATLEAERSALASRILEIELAASAPTAGAGASPSTAPSGARSV